MSMCSTFWFAVSSIYFFIITGYIIHNNLGKKDLKSVHVLSLCLPTPTVFQFSETDYIQTTDDLQTNKKNTTLFFSTYNPVQCKSHVIPFNTVYVAWLDADLPYRSHSKLHNFALFPTSQKYFSDYSKRYQSRRKKARE